MKRYLLSESGTYYKTNLHCHSTFSDGKLTPKEIKELYMKNGYSVVAFTDHNVFISHPELNSEDFLALNGFEVDVNEPKKWSSTTKTCHLCFVAMDERNDKHPLWHRSKYLYANAVKYKDLVKFDETKPDYERYYTPECVSEMIKIGRENGFFVTYNHPRWSLENYNDYINYNGMNAIEIYNYSSCVAGFLDYNSVVYDEMLRAGKKIFCISTDDNHNTHDACGGYIMVKADKLDYKTISDAIMNGNFYSSNGPEISDLWYDEEKMMVHISCSNAERVLCSTGIRKQMMETAKPDDKKLLTEANFQLEGNEIYFRITVIDDKGHKADTNAYFLEDLFTKRV